MVKKLGFAIVSILISGCASTTLSKVSSEKLQFSKQRVTSVVEFANWSESLIIDCDYSEGRTRYSYNSNHDISTIKDRSFKNQSKFRNLNEESLINMNGSIFLIEGRSNDKTTYRTKSKSQSLQVPIVNVEALIQKCNAKLEEQKLAIKKSNEEYINRQISLSEEVAENLGLVPFNINDDKRNISTFVDLVREFQQSGFSQYSNYFLWINNLSQYEVSQIINGGVLLTNRHYIDLPPILIKTEREFLEGQVWSSNYPIKFVTTTSYQTVIGSTKQALVFEELN